MSTTRGVSEDGRYECSYCAGEGKHELARFTVHDARGCLHVCWKHAEWRQTTSMVGGHSADCPHREKEPLVQEAHRALRPWAIWVDGAYEGAPFMSREEALVAALALAHDGRRYHVRLMFDHDEDREMLHGHTPPSGTPVVG